MNTEADQYHPGLEGVVANETAIANLEGREGSGGLEYRGYRIEDLANAVSYEETAFLLLHGDLPTREQLEEFDTRLRTSRGLPESLIRLFEQIPHAVHPMDVLRTSVSVLSHFDPEVNAMRLARHQSHTEQVADIIRQLQRRKLADPKLDPMITAAALGALSFRFAEMWMVHGAINTTLKHAVEQLSQIFVNSIRLKDRDSKE